MGPPLAPYDVPIDEGLQRKARVAVCVRPASRLMDRVIAFTLKLVVEKGGRRPRPWQARDSDCSLASLFYWKRLPVRSGASTPSYLIKYGEETRHTPETRNVVAIAKKQAVFWIQRRKQ